MCFKLKKTCLIFELLQWHCVTNTVWWQDFPRLSTANYLSLFTQFSNEEINTDSKSDFAAQLAGFMAALLADVPSQAHWIMELPKYDFEQAVGYLIASVPGIYSRRSPCISESKHFLVVSIFICLSIDVSSCSYL